jgi:hypothetical protein
MVDARGLDALVDEMRRMTHNSRSPQRVVSGYIARSPIPALVADDSGAYIGANAASLALTGIAPGVHLSFLTRRHGVANLKRAR